MSVVTFNTSGLKTAKDNWVNKRDPLVPLERLDSNSGIRSVCVQVFPHTNVYKITNCDEGLWRQWRGYTHRGNQRVPEIGWSGKATLWKQHQTWNYSAGGYSSEELTFMPNPKKKKG